MEDEQRFATEPFEVKAIQSYKARKKNELNFKIDQVITVTKTNVTEFMHYGKLDGKEGWFPYFYVKSIAEQPKTTAKPDDSHHNPIHSVAHRIATSKRKEKIKKEYVLKSGMIGKKMLSLPHFKQLWCVLRSQKLNYYRSAVDQKVVGKASVKNFKSVEYNAPLSKETKLFCFTIITKKKDDLIFACKTQEECNDWVKMIQFAIKGGQPRLATSQLSENPSQNTPTKKNNSGTWSSGRAPTPGKKEDPDIIKRRLGARPNRLQRQLTLKKLENHLNKSPNAPGAENLIRKIKEMKSSFDPANVPSADDIEFDMVDFPCGEVCGLVRAKFDYLGKTEFELTFRTNDHIILLSKEQKNGWWHGLLDHREGYFPASYVTVLEMKENKSPQTKRAKPDAESTSDEKKESKKDKTKNVSLIENFQIGERIGKGQYGSVYRGINVDNGEMVAIKQVGILNMKKKEIALIMGELELLKEMNHVNIMGYKTFIRTKEHINIVLDLVEGGSLASILGKFGVIPEKLAICYIKQILEGLEYLHARDVIHRDIKCGNILVTKDGSVKLADFGIAMKLGDPSAPAVGSPYWMAPEVIEMRGSSSACDVWALGCTIIELITGQPPYFEFNQVQAMFCMVENERPPFPQNMSKNLESFLEACFKRDPEDRATAKQLKRHPLVRSPDDISDEEEEDDKEFDLGAIEGLDDIDLAALGDLEGYGNFGTDFSASSDFDVSNLEGILDSLAAEPEEFESSDLSSTSGTDFDELDLGSDLDGIDLDGIDFTLENDAGVGQEDLHYLAEDQKTQELLNWFHDSMDKGSVTHAIRIRKTVRNRLEELKKSASADPRFEILVQQVAMAMDRCEDEMGQYIPVDSDEDV